MASTGEPLGPWMEWLLHAKTANHESHCTIFQASLSAKVNEKGPYGINHNNACHPSFPCGCQIQSIVTAASLFQGGNPKKRHHNCICTLIMMSMGREKDALATLIRNFMHDVTRSPAPLCCRITCNGYTLQVILQYRVAGDLVFWEKRVVVFCTDHIEFFLARSALPLENL